MILGSYNLAHIYSLAARPNITEAATSRHLIKPKPLYQAQSLVVLLFDHFFHHPQ